MYMQAGICREQSPHAAVKLAAQSLSLILGHDSIVAAVYQDAHRAHLLVASDINGRGEGRDSL